MILQLNKVIKVKTHATMHYAVMHSLYITQLNNHNMGMPELYVSSYIDWVNPNT